MVSLNYLTSGPVQGRAILIGEEAHADQLEGAILLPDHSKRVCAEICL